MEKPIARDWYEVIPFSDNISLIREKHVADWLRCNMWHVRGRDRDLIIDTGMGLRPLVEEVVSLTERPLTAIMTHCHFDHAGGLHQFEHRCGHPREAQVIAEPTAANTVADTGYVRAETFTALPYEGFRHEDYVVKPAPLTQLLDEGDIIDLGNRVFKVFHMPGHSPGSIALFEEGTGILFSGDVVYDGDLLDTLYHSDPEQFKASLRRVQELPLRTIHGGHYPSFGKQRLSEIIEGYFSGHQRIKNSADWVRDNLS
ncbi:MBL fold metallo-hydrolase [Ruegeria arenilitoris]|uniref:MBL fold metallo-hydrolase n=1 Tax=Ruegeria arenilitoris TaxID=1173585 RepID=UPI0014808087|nr:MBL fold metallo-hydrolase [Ruegeria arenilitoris]